MEKSQIEIAKELGIKNAESLTPAQLKKAIEAANANLDALKALKDKAQELGILFSEDITQEELAKTIETTEEAIENEKAEFLFKEKALAVIEATIGIEKFFELSVDNLVEFLKEKTSATETETVVSGKTEKTFMFNNVEYGFSPKAPENFKFMGFIKSQVDWIEDSDSMELMISGNLSYVQPLKK